MDRKPNLIELGSRIYKEPFTITWHLKNFNLMPFQDDHPVYGPWYQLGKHRNSTWSIVMTKQHRNGSRNVGFKLARADEDGRMWDMVVFSLVLKTEDGTRFVKCIDKRVVGREVNNEFVFLPNAEKEVVNGFGGQASSEMKQLVETPTRLMNGSSNGERSPESFGIGSPGSKSDDSEPEKISSKQNILVNGEKSPEPAKLPEEGSDEYEKNKLTPEELFQQENITVVCEIEYTYMMQDPLPEKVELECDSDSESEDSDLVADFKVLYNSRKFSDITLNCKDVLFPCHKAILYARSKLFKCFLDKLSGGKMQGVDMPKLTRETAPSKDSTSGSSSDQAKDARTQSETSCDTLKAQTDSFEQNEVISADSDKKLVVSINLEPDVCKGMLQFVYTNVLGTDLLEELSNIEDVCWKLYNAAGLFGIPGLKTACTDVMEECDLGYFDEDMHHNLALLSVVDVPEAGNDPAAVTTTSTQTNNSSSN